MNQEELEKIKVLDALSDLQSCFDMEWTSAADDMFETIRTAYEAQVKEIERLRGALEFYAEGDTIVKGTTCPLGGFMDEYCVIDTGEMAKQALKELTNDQE